jgi:Fe-S-cluster containining protein
MKKSFKNSRIPCIVVRVGRGVTCWQMARMNELDIIPAGEAYAGRIGKEREEFCVGFTSQKQHVFRRIQSDIFKQIQANGEVISCHKGCSVCCVLYVEAEVQECEAIVYHLYRNPGTMDHFLRQYGAWRKRMRQLGAPFARSEEILHQHKQERPGQSDQKTLLQALASYHEQDMPCSFLDAGACSIYAVRPYACVNHYVTTPAEWCQARNWCNPDFPNRPKIRMTNIDDLYDCSFYHGNLGRPVIGFMQTMVYRILTGGLEYVSELTGLRALAVETM